MDKIDEIIEQWRTENSNLDLQPMEFIGRIKRLSHHFEKDMTKTFSKYGLNAASFDVLATLKRSGAPYTLSPSELLENTMVTSGTMTNRIDQLVKSKLVKRNANPEDARGCLVSLSQKGHILIDQVIQEHVKTQKRLTSTIPEKDQKVINGILRHALKSIEK